MVMIGSYYGHEINLLGLRSIFNVPERGATLQQLMVIAEKIDLQTRPLKLEIESLPNLILPAVLHWNLNHYVVLKSVTKKGYEIFDPAVGYRVIPPKEIDKSFTGIALEVTPKPNFKPIEASKKLNFSLFFHGQDYITKGLWQSFFLSIIMLIMAMFIPVMMQTVFDEVMPSGDISFLFTVSIAIFVAGMLQVFTNYVRSQLLLSLGTGLSLSYGTALFSHLLTLPLGFFEKRHIGDIVSRFKSFEQIRSFLISGLTNAIVDGMMSLFTVIFMCFYSIKLALLSILILAIYVGLRALAFPALRSLTSESLMREAKENSNFIESMRGIQSIKLYSGEIHRRSSWQALFTSSLNSEMLIARVRNRFQLLNQTLFNLEKAIIVFLGTAMVFNGDLTPGMLIAFLSFKDQFATRVSGLVDGVIQFRMLSVQMDRIADIALADSEKISENQTAIGPIEGKLTLSNVSFRYDEFSPWILKNLTLTINPGEHVAIVGPSGEGKSTLLKAILGFLDLEEGSITIDTHSAKKHRSALQKQMATVMQDDRLLSGTIAENIALFDPNPDQGRIEDAAKKASIYDEIIRMPMGFLSLVGDMGTSLSGGQKQRIMLARALYKSPRILLMDEATSHLDMKAEERINRSIQELNITRIVIAHRLETVMSADRILRLKGGEINEISKQSFERMQHD